MDRAVSFVEGAGRSRLAAVSGLALAMTLGLAACSSPMPPWEAPRTTIQPAPAPRPITPPVATPKPVPPAPPAEPATPREPARVGMANPASAYCLQRGGQLEFSTRPGGGEVGICVSPDGDECEEWEFLRGSCTW